MGLFLVIKSATKTVQFWRSSQHENAIDKRPDRADAKSANRHHQLQNAIRAVPKINSANARQENVQDASGNAASVALWCVLSSQVMRIMSWSDRRLPDGWREYGCWRSHDGIGVWRWARAVAGWLWRRARTWRRGWGHAGVRRERGPQLYNLARR